MGTEIKELIRRMMESDCGQRDNGDLAVGPAHSATDSILLTYLFSTPYLIITHGVLGFYQSTFVISFNSITICKIESS